MTEAPTIIINSDMARQRAIAWLKSAAWNTVVIFKPSRRTVLQSDKLHAMLTDIAKQRLHHGQKHTVLTWKRLFAAAMKREVQLVPNLTDDGFVMVGEKTSEMSKEEVSDMIELAYAYGAQWGIAWSEPDQSATAKDRGAQQAPRQAA